MEVAVNKPKRGRPALSADVAKRHPLNMKTTKTLRSQLETAAYLSGRNISLEVEHRLAESFFPSDIVFGSENTQALLRAIAGVVQVVESATGKEWSEDGETADFAYAAITRILPNSDGAAKLSDSEVAKAVILEMLKRADLDDKSSRKITSLLGEG